MTLMSMESLRMVGVVLWRGGLAFVAGYLFYMGSWRVLVILDWPPQITTGAALALTGLGLVLVSLILEQIAAAQNEGDLLDD